MFVLPLSISPRFPGKRFPFPEKCNECQCLRPAPLCQKANQLSAFWDVTWDAAMSSGAGAGAGASQGGRIS